MAHDMLFFEDRRSGAQRGILENTSARGLSECPFAFPPLVDQGALRLASPALPRESYLDMRISLGNRRSAVRPLFRSRQNSQARTISPCTSIPAWRSNLTTASPFIREASKRTRTVRSFSLN